MYWACSAFASLPLQTCSGDGLIFPKKSRSSLIDIKLSVHLICLRISSPFRKGRRREYHVSAMKHSFLNFALPSRLVFQKGFNKAVCPHYSKSCNEVRSFLFLLAALYWCCRSVLGCIMQVRHISYTQPELW